MLNLKSLKAELLLLLTALIWGFAFVAQRVGMDHVGPFTYTGVRFSAGRVVAPAPAVDRLAHRPSSSTEKLADDPRR